MSTHERNAAQDATPGSAIQPGESCAKLSPDGSDAQRQLHHVLHAPTTPLEQCLDDFWEPGASLERMPGLQPPGDAPLSVLKRLGPSPFSGSGFPLIGFLASVYERVSQAARQRYRVATRVGQESE